MKINLDFKFKKLNGEWFHRPEDSEDLSLRTVCVEALLGNYQDERIEGAEKLLRYKLAMKIFHAGDEVELSAEEIVLVKKLIAKMFSVLVTGQAWEYIES